MANYEDIEKLNDLRQRGIISEEEFQREKDKIFNAGSAKPVMTTEDINRYCVFIHLSQLLVFFMGIGLVVPVILWMLKKDESPIIDRHGQIVLNWILSLLVYGACAGILSFLIVGIPLLIALGVCNVVFIILGTTKAQSGELWKYPLSIEFFKITP